MKQILFLLIQFISLFNPNSISLEQIQSIPIFEVVLAEKNIEKKTEINNSLSIAAGIDRKLSRSEWSAYLSANPAFKFDKSNEKVFQIVDAALKNSESSTNLQKPNLDFKSVFKKEKTQNFDVLVYGNEVSAVAVAVTAARILGKNGHIVLVRPEAAEEYFGGLISQGGLAYLDRNQMGSFLSPSSDFYREFLNRSRVKRIAVNPELADRALREMLSESGVKLLSGTRLKAIIEDGKIKYVLAESSSQQLKAQAYIDATQNADLARQAGLHYEIGFTSLGFPKATLPVSPIFQTKGLTVGGLRAIEEKILNDSQLILEIKSKIKEETGEDFSKWLLQNLDKKMFVGQDYIDVRSVVLGAAYHLYKNKPYDFHQGFLFDRPNIAVLADDHLSWNALLYKFSSVEVMDLVDKGSKPTEEMLNELKSIEAWLRTFEEGKNVKLIPPKELYIRHSLNITDVKKPLTGQQIIHGGTSPNQSVGTFCYYFDVRGGIEGFGGKMPKPIFNFGIDHSLTKFDNLAVVGRSAGYYGLAPAAGRILELNVSIGSYIGAAAALSVQNKKPLNQISSLEARQAVEKLTGLPVVLKGKDISDKVTNLNKII